MTMAVGMEVTEGSVVQPEWQGDRRVGDHAVLPHKGARSRPLTPLLTPLAPRSSSCLTNGERWWGWGGMVRNGEEWWARGKL